jgi:putative DNA primase/helicase
MDCEVCGAVLDPDGTCFVCGIAGPPEPEPVPEPAPEPTAEPQGQRTRSRNGRVLRRALFDDGGLRARTAADAVAELGPLRYGPVDGRFWVYESGVWRPGERDVHGRIVSVLGERYRPGHGHAIRDVLRSTVPELLVQPVSGLINFRNGMVDWGAPRAPRHVPHQADVGSTVQLPIDWNPDADCADFEAFLAQAVAPDDQARVWEIVGYLMMSGNPLQRLFLFTGGGGNGKGVLMAVIREILGRGNVSAVALAEFTDDAFATADIYGTLANICGDIDTTYIEKTGLIKKMAGEDEIRAQRKYGQPFGFEYWGKALFSANGIPTAADSSQGWLRRWEIVNFPYEPVRPDLGLKARLCAAGSLEGVAVRAVAALRRLMARGQFDHGEAATAAHSEFAMRNNKLLAWIDDTAYRDPGKWYPRDVLLASFRRWDHVQNPGGRQIAAATFYERLRQVKGVREAKIKGTRGVYGIRLSVDAIVLDYSGADLDVESGGQAYLPPQDGLF